MKTLQSTTQSSTISRIIAKQQSITKSDELMEYESRIMISFIIYIMINRSFQIIISLKHHLYIEGIGNDIMTMRIDNISIMNPVNNNRILKRILHVPKFKNDLMSFNQLALER